MPVDLDSPGVRVHCMDPPVLTVDSFLAESVCEVRARSCAVLTQFGLSQGRRTVYAVSRGSHCSFCVRGFDVTCTHATYEPQDPQGSGAWEDD